MLKKASIFLAIAIAIFLGFAALQPSEFRIERSLMIHAPATIVFDQVNSFHNWVEWSPWAKQDHPMSTKYEGPESGIGASYSWSSEAHAGAGKMTIMTSLPEKRVDVKLEFSRPMSSLALAEFVFTSPAAATRARAEETNVTWTMSGSRPFPSKVLSLVLNMDKLVGQDFEKGLESLKARAEASAHH